MNAPQFISIQGSYNKLELALFENNNCLELIKEQNLKASSLFIPLLQELFKKNSVYLKNIQFIALDQGPGAFTSLRVTIATANGISFAGKIPLIGIDGLDALAQETLNEFSHDLPEILICILNAYNNDIYFSINKVDKQTKQIEVDDKGYKKIDLFLQEIQNKFKNKKILFTGNGIELHKNLILETLKNEIQFSDLQTCSANQIAKMALEKWNQQKGLSFKLYPLYLKSQNFAIRPKHS